MPTFVFDYNSGISWSIFILFVPVETGMNTLQPVAYLGFHKGGGATQPPPSLQKYATVYNILIQWFDNIINASRHTP